MPFYIRKSEDKDGKDMFCAYKEEGDAPKACADTKKDIELYIAFAENSDRKKEKKS